MAYTVVIHTNIHNQPIKHFGTLFSIIIDKSSKTIIVLNTHEYSKNIEKVWAIKMLKPIRKKHYLILHPRPVYVVGSGHYGEKYNLMAVSWATPVSEDPPKVVISVEKETYTYELIERYGEYTINVLEENYLDKIWLVGTVSGKDVNKIAKLNLHVRKGVKVNAPIIEEAVGIVETKVTDKIEAGECMLFVGEILYALADTNKYNERYCWNVLKAKLVHHIAGKAFMTNGKLVFPRK